MKILFDIQEIYSIPNAFITLWENIIPRNILLRKILGIENIIPKESIVEGNFGWSKHRPFGFNLGLL